MIARAISLVFAVLLAACAVNPVTGQRELTLVSERDEIALGQSKYGEGQQISGGEFILDPALTTYVRTVLSALGKVSDRPQLPYEIVIANDSSPNAWAMPGGKLAINRGLLLELGSEAELAAVLSHEVVHAAARHGARQMEKSILFGVGAAAVSAGTRDSRFGNAVDLAVGVGAGLVGLKYGRENELEADRFGMVYMTRAGYDPQAAVSLQETFVRLSGEKRRNWLSGMLASHPPSQERVDANRRMAAALPPPNTPYRNGRPEHQAAISKLRKAKPAYDAYDAGVKALAESKFAEAISLADTAIRTEAREALFYALRGRARDESGDQRGAEADYDEAIRRNPNYFGPWLNRGKLKLSQRRSAEGESDLLRSYALLATPDAQLALGRVAYGDGRQQRALELLAPLAESNPEAAAIVTRIELPNTPAKFLAIEKRLDSSGRLVLVIGNRSPLALTQIEGIVGIVGDGGKIRAEERFRLAQLAPGAKIPLTLNLRPGDHQAGVDQTVVRISGARAP